METSHKIEVSFARSVKRNIDVHIEDCVDYEETEINHAHYKPDNGSTTPTMAITVTITGLILIFILTIVKIVFNG